MMNDDIDDSLIYNSPSEKQLFNLKVKEGNDFALDALESVEDLAAENDTPRFSDIFDEPDEFLPDSAGTFLRIDSLGRNVSELQIAANSAANYNDESRIIDVDNGDDGNKCMTFSDRVLQETRKLRCKESLRRRNYPTSNEIQISSRPVEKGANYKLRSVQLDRKFDSLPKCTCDLSGMAIEAALELPISHKNEYIARYLECNSLSQCMDATNEWLDSKCIEIDQKYEKISHKLHQQSLEVQHLRHRIQSEHIQQDKKQDELKTIKDTLSRVVEENEQLCKENKSLQLHIDRLKVDMDGMESNLIIERKHNEEALKDKIQLQNKISMYSQENEALHSSQEALQNLHKNEIEELTTRKSELSNRIVILQRDVDYFKDNLHESHKKIEQLKIEIYNMKDKIKQTQLENQKLKSDNRRLQEDNSIYRSQNLSLIEINDRLRNRSMFKYSDPLAHVDPTNNYYISALTTQSNATNDSLHSSDFSSISSHFDKTEKDNSMSRFGADCDLGGSMETIDQLAPLQRKRTCAEVQEDDNSTTGADDRASSVALEKYEDFSARDHSIFNVSLYPDESENVHDGIKPDKLQHPTTRWVMDKVSKQSSVDALQNLKEKIRSINFENAELLSKFGDTTINNDHGAESIPITFIQNKLRQISQQLNGVNTNCLAH